MNNTIMQSKNNSTDKHQKQFTVAIIVQGGIE